MTFQDYMVEAHKFATYEKETYPMKGLLSEIGELIGKEARIERGDYSVDDDVFKQDVKKELGDIFWMLSELFQQIKEEPVDMSYVYSEYMLYMALTDLIKEHNIYNLCNVYAVMMGYLEQNRISLSEVLQMNLDKLTDRESRGKIKGSGDNR